MQQETSYTRYNEAYDNDEYSVISVMVINAVGQGARLAVKRAEIMCMIQDACFEQCGDFRRFGATVKALRWCFRNFSFEDYKRVREYILSFGTDNVFDIKVIYSDGSTKWNARW